MRLYTIISKKANLDF